MNYRIAAFQLDKQLRFLNLSSTTWVRNAPEHPNEACMVMSRLANDHMAGIGAYAWTVIKQVLLDMGEPCTNSLPSWNDYHAKDKEHVIQVLEKALARAEEFS
jgi:hypothetical protein